MKVDELTVKFKITNKDKLSNITDNIIKLAGLAKDSPEAENICSDIIKNFDGLFAVETEINKWKEAYENMRDFAIKSGLDIKTRN